VKVSYLAFYDTFSTNRLYHATEAGNVTHTAGRTQISCNKITKEYNKPTQS